MSAINDALRRASSAAKSTPSADGQAPPPLPPMPVNYPPGSTNGLPPVIAGAHVDLPPLSESSVPPARRSVLPYLFALLVLLCVFGAGASFLYARKNGPVLGKSSLLAQLQYEAEEEEAEEVPENEIRPNARPATVAAPAPAQAPVASPVVARPVATAANPPAAAVASAPVAPSVPIAPVRFPALKLQSIFYRPNNPSVMINSKTLFVSDEISGVTVAEIKPSSVTLVLSGQTNILTLR